MRSLGCWGAFLSARDPSLYRAFLGPAVVLLPLLQFFVLASSVCFHRISPTRSSFFARWIHSPLSPSLVFRLPYYSPAASFLRLVFVYPSS